MALDLHTLPKLRDGLSYLYVEHARIEQDALSIAIWKKDGTIQVPAASLGVLMLGPGTTITHAAVRALADNGCSLVWCGEDGIRCYAQGGGETRKAYRLLQQAAALCSPTERLEVVWRMYDARFGYRLNRQTSLETIRGMEGARVRECYAEAAREYCLAWQGRKYDRADWKSADPLNRALSAANACLNGVCHTAIVSGGYSTALGFMHTGKQLSFVYDIADLYKAELTIPLAFRIVAESPLGVDSRVRSACRETFTEARLLKRILPDIDRLLGIGQDETQYEQLDTDASIPTALWSELFGLSSEVANDRNPA
ncbi:MAG: type I-E CRISPR-associated endonuclease Cas1e [Chloroflexi bacterium]|nr:type I-E CRISPR-associated endonuclease Cas1e [Chloroflexota bacterium]